jgi:hypothetical protein
MKQFITFIVNLVDNSKSTKQFLKYVQKYCSLPFEIFFIYNEINTKHLKLLYEITNANNDIHALDTKEYKNVLSEILSEMQGTVIIYTTNSYLPTKKFTKNLSWYLKNNPNISIIQPTFIPATQDNIKEQLDNAKAQRKLYKHFADTIKIDNISKDCFIFNEKILTKKNLLALIDNKTITIDEILNECTKPEFTIIHSKDIIFLELSKQNITANEDKDFTTKHVETDDTIQSLEEELPPIANNYEVLKQEYKNRFKPEIDVISNYEKAKNKLQNREYDNALTYLIHALDVYYNDFSPKQIDLKDLYSLAGQVALHLNKPELALHFFEEELKLEDNSSRACEGLADAFILMDEPIKAKIMLQWAYKCDNENLSARNKLNKINTLLGLEENDITVE